MLFICLIFKFFTIPKTATGEKGQIFMNILSVELPLKIMWSLMVVRRQTTNKNQALAIFNSNNPIRRIENELTLENTLIKFLS